MGCHMCCLTCVKPLSAWYAGQNVHMKFGVPTIWGKKKGHSHDCDFCQHEFTGCTTAKKRKHIVYPNLQSIMRPVEHSIYGSLFNERKKWVSDIKASRTLSSWERSGDNTVRKTYRGSSFIIHHEGWLMLL